jgi:hypothetical protein
MKIKIRPDEADPSGTGEWAAVHDWLADLREDGQGEPDHGRFAGTDRERYAEPDHGHYAEPDHGRFTGTDHGHYAEPDHGRYPGTSSDGYAAAHREGHSGGYVQPPSRGEPRVMTPPPAPRHGYVSRPRTSAPAETAAVRAVIGDELRTPTAWCEMSSCISRHADRSALGEADVRARAIGAGWRIDALGRLVCPQCLQTSASFRATRPVVPWDRATAISMAARAMVRGNRTSGPAGADGYGTQRQADGRGTRRPAHGHR